jgi:hypothetical protein
MRATAKRSLLLPKAYSSESFLAKVDNSAVVLLRIQSFEGIERKISFF